MDDEILKGYPLSAFLQSEKFCHWNPETRRYYTNCLHDLQCYTAQHGEPTERLLAEWIEHLRHTYGRKAINVHIAAANQYFRWCGRLELIRPHIKPDTDTDPPTPTVTRVEYLRLLRVARALGKQRTYLLIKLFATTDLPMQCLNQVTVALLRQGCGILRYRGDTIDFRCPRALQQELFDYIAKNGICCGPVFVSRNGRPLSRVNVFRNLQEICQAAGVPEEKGNPRSLRNLYKDTQKQIDERLAIMKDEMYDHLLEIEQVSIAWPVDTAEQKLTTG